MNSFPIVHSDLTVAFVGRRPVERFLHNWPSLDSNSCLWNASFSVPMGLIALLSGRLRFELGMASPRQRPNVNKRAREIRKSAIRRSCRMAMHQMATGPHLSLDTGSEVAG